MPRSISDLQVPHRSPAELWPVMTSWLGSNGFTILTSRADGNQKVISHWDGALLLRPRQGACVALREQTGGGTIVFEISTTSTNEGSTVHIEGYATGRGPGWKGKEYDLIPKNLAIAGVLRKRGLSWMEGLQQTLLSRAAASPLPSVPLRSTGALPETEPPVLGACRQCGQPIPPGARFCSACGSSTVEVPAQSSPPFQGGRLQTTITPTPASSAPIGGVGSIVPRLPLLPGETLLGRYTSSIQGEKRVLYYNMYIMMAIFGGILLPILALTLLTRPFSPILLIFLYPFLLVLGMLFYLRYSVGRKGPTQVFVTNRRILVDQAGKETSSSMSLENVGRVEVNVDSRGVRRAGVAWVYILPIGTPKAIVGRGRGRHAAPGVLWIPAVPLDIANSLRTSVIANAVSEQSRLGYPVESRAQ